jgi:hypothetical protein
MNNKIECKRKPAVIKRTFCKEFDYGYKVTIDEVNFDEWGNMNGFSGGSIYRGDEQIGSFNVFGTITDYGDGRVFNLDLPYSELDKVPFIYEVIGGIQGGVFEEVEEFNFERRLRTAKEAAKQREEEIWKQIMEEAATNNAPVTDETAADNAPVDETVTDETAADNAPVTEEVESSKGLFKSSDDSENA